MKIILFKIFKFLKILKNIKYLNLETKRKKIIIFDNTGIVYLKKYLLKNYDYLIIDNRFNDGNIYFSFSLLLALIKKLLKFYFNKNLKIQDIYFITLIELINPNLVLTIIDISLQFSRIAKYSEKKSIIFIALQMTLLPQRNYMSHLFKKNILKKNLNTEYYFPVYLGFGEFQKENLIKNKVQVDNFFSVGSVRLANFLKSNNYDFDNKVYDICTISDFGALDDKFGSENVQLENINLLKQKFIKVIKWSIKLAKEKKLKFIFVFKRRIEQKKEINDEKQFYKNFLTKNEYEFLEKNCSYNSQNNLDNSYQESFRSHITIGVSSTLLVEGLMSKNKILSCNFTGLDIFDYPMSGICLIKDCEYEEFKNRVLKIIKMNNAEYYSQLSKDKSYLMPTSDPNETFNLLKKQIDKYLT